MDKLTESSRHQMLFLALVYVLSCFVNGEISSNQTEWEPCSLYCNCSILDDFVMAKCDLSSMKHCESFVLPDHTLMLDLSKNSLVEVPFCVLNKSASIIYLSLSDNNIGELEAASFPVLAHLLHVDLSHNRLKEWKGNISTTLPSLESVDFTGNHFFIPNNNLFSLHNLVEVNGVTWSMECGECHLIKTEVLMSLNDSESQCIIHTEDYSFVNEVKYGKSISFVKQGFSPQCICEHENCAAEEIFAPYNLQLNTLPRKLFFVEYIFGVIAVVLNLVVVLISFGSRSLRKSTPFILIGNIGFCDVMMGVYSVLIGRFTVYEFIVNESAYNDMDVFVNKYCTVMGVIFTTAQITSVSSSFLATLERYLSIVHCMNPTARLRKPVALWCLAGIWCVAISYSLLAVFQVGGLRYHGEFSCVLPFINGPEISDTSTTGLAVVSLLVVFYLISFALYIHIFFHVKKSGISAGVKRKASLAKNISIMVFTNFIFFVIPMVCTLLFVFRYEELASALNVDSFKKLQIYFIMLSWLPIVFLSFNSCLNPFLCAFRHPKFKRELHTRVKRCKCRCIQTSRGQLSQAWTLKATKRVDLNSTDSIVRTETMIIDRYRSLETL